jgi:hypothetical protein
VGSDDSCDDFGIQEKMGEMMPIFVCEKCGICDNTALTRFWVREKGEPALCSKCDPKIGKWHGCFERKKPKKGIKYINRK